MYKQLKKLIIQYWLYLFLTALVFLMFLVIGILMVRDYRESINGIIQDFYIGEKGDPVVFINGKKTPLGSFATDLSPYIEIGDSIEKRANTFCYSLYKKDRTGRASRATKTRGAGIRTRSTASRSRHC